MPDVGDVIPLTNTIRDSDNALADAGSMSLTIIQPDGTDATVPNPIASTTTGVYRFNFTPTQYGRHVAEWVATGANAGAESYEFYVAAVVPGGVITVADLPVDVQSHELVAMMVAGANAKASRVAPCLVDTETAPTPGQLAEARLVLVGAIKRWAEAGSGALSQETVGPFGVTVDTRQRTGFNLWPSEIEQLQDICLSGTDSSSGAFSITPTRRSAHLPWCSLAFGALYCSCGVDIAGEPIFELTDGDLY